MNTLMNKIISLVLLLFICLSMCSCSSQNDSKEIDYSREIDYLGNDFTWSMSVSDAEKYIEKNQINKHSIEIKKSSDNTSVTDDYYRFVFYDDFDGKLGRVIINIENAVPGLEHFYGKADKIVDKNSYYWYGTMGGKETTVFYMNSIDSLMFNLKEYWDNK